jgi:superfamily II DNA or RNA helicase
MTRETLKERALRSLSSNERLILQWATGLGKSLVGIAASQRLLNEGSEPSILILVAETNHKENWKQEFIKWGYDHLLKYVRMECYHSIHKLEGEKYDLIILDEAHHLSDKRFESLCTIDTTYVLALSATMPQEIRERLESRYGKFIVDKVTLNEAIKWGILPKPKLIVIPLELDNRYKTETVTIEWGTKSKRKLINTTMSERWQYSKNKKEYPHAKLVIRCTAKEKYDYLEKQIKYRKGLYMSNRKPHNELKWLLAGNDRKRFLSSLKTDYLVPLLINLRHKRFICFCGSIDQAVLLSPSTCIHSKRDDSSEIIEKFNNKEINSLYAVGMIQEGQNLSDIEAGIIVQLDGTTRGFIQKMGRTMRSDSPLQFIFYIKGTKDEDYLEKALEGLNEEYIRVVDNYEEVLEDDNMFK